MPTPSKFEEIQRAKGYSLREIGVAGTGLARTDALAAIDALAGSDIAILSGDVLRLTAGHPQYTYSNWRARRGIGEGFPEFAARSLEIARAYISAYAEQPNQPTLYTLVLADADSDAVTSSAPAFSLA
jgi:hypothetical protein